MYPCVISLHNLVITSNGFEDFSHWISSEHKVLNKWFKVFADLHLLTRVCDDVCSLALITSGSRWGESGKHWSSFPWMSHRGLNYCSIGIKDKKIQSVIREGCGLQQLNTLHDASFQAQIRVWEAARGRMLESDNVPPSVAGDEAEDGLLVAAWSSLNLPRLYVCALDPVADFCIW